MNTELDELACQLAAEAIIAKFRTTMTLDERLNAVNYLHSEAFFPERDPRSAEYKAGAMWALKTRFELPAERTTAKVGTAALDAWYSGADEGRDLYRSWLRNWGNGAGYWHLFAQHFDGCGGDMSLFWCALDRKLGGQDGNQH